MAKGTLKRSAVIGGSIIGTAAAAVALITTPWAAVLSALVATALATFKWTRDIAMSPPALVGAGAWLTLWWTYIGFRVLRAQVIPAQVMVSWDCSHCIAVEGVGVGYDKESPDGALQFIIGMRNLGNGPIKLKVEEFRALLGDRVVPDKVGSEIIVPRLSTKGIVSNPFKSEAIQARNEGEISLTLIYGRHDAEFSRRFKFKARVHVHISEEKIGVGNDILSESDEDI